MEPSEVYQPVMATMHEKIYLSKVVIELCEEEPNASYEDLLNRIEVCHTPLSLVAAPIAHLCSTHCLSGRPQCPLPPSDAPASPKTLS